MTVGPTWWVGVDEAGGLPNPGRPDVVAPPWWRLEAVAATPRVRHAEVSPTGDAVAFVVDRDTSDVHVVSLDRTGAPVAVTTGRTLAAYWEDGGAVWSPDGTRLAITQAGAVHLVPVGGGPTREVCAGSSPVWLDDRRLVVGIERHGRTHLAVVEVDGALTAGWPVHLASAGGDCVGATVSPDRTRVAYGVFHHDDLNCTSLRVVDVVTGDDHELHRIPGINSVGPAWSPDGSTIAFACEQPGWYEVHVVAASGGPVRQVTTDGADFSALRWWADGAHLSAVRTRAGVADLVTVDASTGAVQVLAAGGTWSTPHCLSDGSVVAVHESSSQPSRLCRVLPDGAVEVLVDLTPAAVRVAPHVVPQHVTYTAHDGREVYGWLYRPAGASAAHRCPAVVQPHGGPTSHVGDEWEGVVQYFVDLGYAWFAPNVRGSTSYGREFERANHGVWGVADTADCLAAHDLLASFDWIDPTRIAVFGGSYGSYLALHAVVDDPQHRYACAVAKYGDCDIVTSWAQGDQVGRLDLERMMGHPRGDRAAWRAGSPIHRVEQLAVPVLVAHGELDARVHVAQSRELVEALRRLGKQYEYVTYPTEGHGLLRTEPFLHFHQRLQRFLDWHLMR
jgi:dipeptidyl aminopeptidase/acylaminoacyl peptidase